MTASFPSSVPAAPPGTSPSATVPGPQDIPARAGATPRGTLLVWAGAASLALPTLYGIATGPWAQEDGVYGVIVLAIAIWLVVRGWPKMVAAGVPGRALPGWMLFALALALHVLARIVLDSTFESATLYLVGLAALYLRYGGAGVRRIAFPLFYLALAIPLPPVLVALATTALRLALTDGAVRVLHDAGYAIAGEGLDIYIDQYRIAVAEACSGINSMVSLTAIGLFYVHVRDRRLGPVTLPLVLASILACAAAGNFVRVLVIVLLTHYAGEGVAQGPLHELAGLVTFAVSLGGVMLLDALVYRHLPAGSGFE